MKKATILVFILIFIFGPYEIRGQDISKDPSQSSAEIPINPKLFFNRIVVYRLNDTTLSGVLVGVESNALIVRVGIKNEKVFSKSLVNVAIEIKKKTGKNALFGTLAGTYLGNLIFFWARNQPTAYREAYGDRSRDNVPVFWNFLFAAVGAGAGILSDSIFEKGEKVFVFSGNEINRQSEWERLRDFILGKIPPKKIHLSIQGGHVFTQAAPTYVNLLQNAGYSIGPYAFTSYYYSPYIYWNSSGFREEATNFNLLRKFQITFSTAKNIEIGLAFYWLGEPLIYAYREKRDEISDQLISRASVNQKTNTKGYYIVGIFKPLRRKLPKNIAWNVGFGAGAAKKDFSLESTVDIVYPDNESIPYEHRISKYCFSGVVFTELNLSLHDNLSFGLAADYVSLPAENVPAFLEADIPAQRLRFGTASIGFTLAIHF